MNTALIRQVQRRQLQEQVSDHTNQDTTDAGHPAYRQRKDMSLRVVSMQAEQQRRLFSAVPPSARPIKSPMPAERIRVQHRPEDIAESR